MASIHDLQECIAAHFPPWNPELEAFLPDITEAEFEELLELAPQVEDAERPRFHGLILYRLLGHHPDAYAESIHYDLFIMNFNGLHDPEEEKEMVDFLNSHTEGPPVKDDHFKCEWLTEQKRESLSVFNREQREDILAWLEEARDWPCSRMLQDDIRDAIAFMAVFKEAEMG